MLTSAPHAEGNPADFATAGHANYSDNKNHSSGRMSCVVLTLISQRIWYQVAERKGKREKGKGKRERERERERERASGKAKARQGKARQGKARQGKERKRVSKIQVNFLCAI